MRKLFLILYLSLLSLCSFGQIQMFLAGSGGGGAGVTYLLDEYPGAAAAYALVNLTFSWVGLDVILVRRSSDDAELGFTQDEITDGTLIAWVGAGDGFITTWYDQSGNGRNAIQSTIGLQPKIVSSGVLITENGEAAIHFDGTNDYIQSSAFTLASQPVTRIVVASYNSFESSDYLIDNTSSVRGVIGVSNTGANWRLFAGSVSDYATGPLTSTQYLLYGHFDGASSYLSVNGSNLGSKSVGTGGLSQVTIGTDGAGASARAADANIQLVICYGSSQSASRTAIETIINDIYSIY